MSALFGCGKQNSTQNKSKRVHCVFTVKHMVIFLLFALTVCLYLTRLEAHTGADIFLPLNYHSIMEIRNSEEKVSVLSETDAITDYLNSSYQKYAQQEGRPYTIRQDILLSRLAYIKAPEGFRGETAGVTVQELCREIESILDNTTADAVRLFGRNREEILDITTEIGKHSLLGELVICDYITNASGLSGYVLEKDNEITITLRGTDDAADMLDNIFLLPFNLSIQYADIRELLEKYGSVERIWLTGHSKGGHNAIYAASIDSRCRATGFNTPGFGIFLSDAQHDGLDLGVNYVINGDVTGFLLFHLERRIILESSDSIVSKGLSLNNRHRLDNFFSVDNLTIAEKIQPLSIWVEWITQILWLVLIFLAVYKLTKLRLPLITIKKLSLILLTVFLTAAAPLNENGIYEVYINGVFENRFDEYENAVSFAEEHQNAAVRIKGKSRWIWDNYMPYNVFITMEDYHEFNTFADAVKFAKEYSSSYIYYRKDSSLIWSNADMPKESVLIKAPQINQLPELPRGCEVTSLAMMLQHKGITLNTDKMTLAEKIKKDDTPVEYINSKLYAGNPNNGFIGSMYDFSKFGLGVYHQPIYELLTEYLPYSSLDITGCEFEDLYYFLERNTPVWVIINSWYSRLPASEFETWHTPDGEIKITYREHSVLVTGYDEDYIYFNDPLDAAEKAAKNNFIEAWEQMGRQAVTYTP